MTYVIIGLVCSAVGCKWIILPGYPEFETQAACTATVDVSRPKQATAFDMSCAPKHSDTLHGQAP